jgi:CTP synthase (UTP-ammonia lyase)
VKSINEQSEKTKSGVTQICLVGDYNPEVIAHQAIPKALELAADGTQVQPTWLDTESALTADLNAYDGFWCVPASPYRSMEGALRAIRFAREGNRPFLGTCGGCQHAVIEFSRNVLHIAGAGHTEVDTSAADPVITNLACALIEADECLRTVDGSRLKEIYGTEEIRETYHCSYGLNPAYLQHLADGGLRIGVIANGEARGLELAGHPFFFATLFQPERSALKGNRHPLIAAFVEAAGSQASLRK